MDGMLARRTHFVQSSKQEETCCLPISISTFATPTSSCPLRVLSMKCVFFPYVKTVLSECYSVNVKRKFIL